MESLKERFARRKAEVKLNYGFNQPEQDNGSGRDAIGFKIKSLVTAKYPGDIPIKPGKTVSEDNERYTWETEQQKINRMTYSQALGRAIREKHNGQKTNKQACSKVHKQDQGKARWDLMPFVALNAVAEVITWSMVKYPADNWRSLPNGKIRFIAACYRHLFAYMTGEKNDKESGLHHLAHVACCVLYVLELIKTEEVATDEKG